MEGELARSAVAGDAPVAIRAHDLGKAYTSFASPLQRLGAVLFRRGLPHDTFWALRGVDLELRRGEVLGVIGQNGAGKSTLLQLLCGTLQPSTGSLQVQGRIAALLELGAGFNPEFTGRDNLLLNGPLLGLTRDQLQERLPEIIAFSGIADFVDHPVKTYSSGMFVRLAFSLATSVDPDILVVDEALSVGDGEFARKSFDRIQQMKERGTTILFCSHALYQVEAFCHRVLWLDHGTVRGLGAPHQVVREYAMFLAAQAAPAQAPAQPGVIEGGLPQDLPIEAARPTETPGHARITRIDVSLDGVVSNRLRSIGGQGELRIDIEFESDPALAVPTAGMTFELGTLIIVSAVVSKTDGVQLARDANGRGRASIVFDGVPLRKGEYFINVYLGSEDAVHLYSEATRIAVLEVVDTRPEPGVVDVPHRWVLPTH
jgi:lipopolysaccharide transport system ATP-binding protein